MILLYKISISLGVAFLIATAAVVPGDCQEIARGRQLYLEHCAVCHGRNGNGRGPMWHALSTPPTNLRRLSETYGNPLPTDKIASFIDGRAEVRGHGPRDMPVWGRLVWQNEPSEGVPGQVAPAIASLVAYLQSIQESTRPLASR
jgi:mono/diheme cytochrome c family protein